MTIKNGKAIKDPFKILKIKPTLGRNLTKEYLKKIKIKRLKKNK